jgi:hypothetical protein
VPFVLKFSENSIKNIDKNKLLKYNGEYIVNFKENKMFLNKFSILIISLVLVLAGCDTGLNGGGNNNGNNGNNGNKTAQKLTVGYMSNFMVDIGDATGLGIARKSQNGNRNARAVADNTEGKFYLVKTTVDFSHETVDWDEAGLTNVSFKKKTTVNETIGIPKVDGEGNPVYLTDGEGNPILDEEGNPIQDIEIIETQTVTQDEIPAQVNRLYVHNTYTFIQFVPKDTYEIPDTRPGDLGTPDKNGYFAYDKRDFYNDDYHQSFVIENSTGNIYSVENAVYIETIHNGLLKIKDNPYVWDLRIQDNDELEIFSLFQNATVTVSDYFKDKYGRNYIFNALLDQYDDLTNTIYYTNPIYHLSMEGEVLYTEFATFPQYGGYWEGRYNNEHPAIFLEIKIVSENGTLRTINSDENITFNEESSVFGARLSHISNGKLYIYWTNANMRASHFEIDVNTLMQKGFTSYIDAYSGVVSLSYNYVLIWTGTSNIDQILYYYEIPFNTLNDVRFYTDYSPNNENDVNILINNGEAKSLLNNCRYTGLWYDHYFNPQKNTWTVTTLSSTIDYTVILEKQNDEQVPVVIKTSEYIAEEQQIIKLKPINR